MEKRPSFWLVAVASSALAFAGACAGSDAPAGVPDGGTSGQDAVAQYDAWTPQYDAYARPDAPGCVEECTAGTRQCVTGGYQECGNFDADSCNEWGPPTACPAGQKCVQGTCQVTCTDECTQGNVKCTSDGTGTQACVQGASGCWEWDTAVTCPPGQTCSGGKCSAACTDECDTGGKQCSGDGYQECGQYDTDLCLDWGPVVDCPPNQTCSNGECESSCSNECTADAKECVSTDGFKTCGDYDQDPCLEWSSATPCPPNQTCSNGECSETCENECDDELAKECTTSGTGFRVCGNYDSDECLEWGNENPCDPDTETCINGDCVESCDCDFYEGICEPDAPDSTTPCACDPDCDGGGTPCGADGVCDPWCPLGVDPDCGCYCDFYPYCEADEDYTLIEPPPPAYSEGTCECDPDCELHDYACMDDGFCDTWCLPESDPDCDGVDPCRTRLMSIGWRFGDELYLSGNYLNPDPDYGEPWVLLSPEGWSGEGSAEMFVEMAAENAACVTALVMDVYGHDHSSFGDGAEMYLWNWDTGGWDLLPDETVGWRPMDEPDLFSNWVLDPAPYLLCGTNHCWVDARVRASTWDHTHVLWAEVWALMSPQ